MGPCRASMSLKDSMISSRGTVGPSCALAPPSPKLESEAHCDFDFADERNRSRRHVGLRYFTGRFELQAASRGARIGQSTCFWSFRGLTICSRSVIHEAIACSQVRNSSALLLFSSSLVSLCKPLRVHFSRMLVPGWSHCTERTLAKPG